MKEKIQGRREDLCKGRSGWRLFPLPTVFVAGGVVLVCLFSSGIETYTFAQTIVDEWPTVKAPNAPELKPVTIDSKVTALLVLDIVKPICNAERTPRCVSSVPKLQGLVNQARAKGVSVIYSLGGKATPADIWKEVAPREGEPIVESNADKFFKTDLEKILKEKGITTVILVGTWANGAVLSTTGGAVVRGFQVIVPVDGMSAPSTYIEQYVTWHIANSPATRGVTLTRIDMIKF